MVALRHEIGAPVDRVDGPLKVAGAAPYPSDVDYPGMVYAHLVRSAVATGRIQRIATAEAEHAPGVLGVLTHLNAPKLERGPITLIGPSGPQPPLRDERVLHWGQYIAAVVADTPQNAVHAARLITADYSTTDPLLDLADARASIEADPYGLAHQRGDVQMGLAQAAATVDATYETAENSNNPLGLFATVAVWDGDTVVVHTSTQWPASAQAAIAAAFELPNEAVHVLAPFIGGGFGSGLRVHQHTLLAILAARVVGRPVKLVLTRPQMFTGIGHRPRATQRLRLGASADGELTAMKHEATVEAAAEDDNFEPITVATAHAYACPNVSVGDQQVRLTVPLPGAMRAPGEAQGNFALESGMDELASQLELDPLELRLRNYAEVNPESGKPWSSNALRTCYEVGAERFGWSDRDPHPGAMRDGRWRVGYGLAGVSYSWWQVPCQARATITVDGQAFVRSAASDPGTGALTVMSQLASELLGLDLAHLRFELGDSDMPWAPAAGGSGLTTSLGTAVHSACTTLRDHFVQLAASDAASPLQGCSIADVTVTDGRISRLDDERASESFVEVLERHGLPELSAHGSSAPPDAEESAMALAGPFAAKFVEVRVDNDLGLIRIPRVVIVVDAGRILNEKLAKSQIVGGTIGGIGHALFEDVVHDAGTGRVANGTFGDYLIPVNADIGNIDVTFVGKPDPLTAIGTKGVGEIGVPGTAAAIANGIYHATGRRIRSLPIALDKLL